MSLKNITSQTFVCMLIDNIFSLLIENVLKLRNSTILIASLIVFNCITFPYVSASVLRTCSELRVDDCKTVNKGHYCYCHRQLCNGENAESIIEKLGDVNDDEAEENENFDSDEASGSDDEDFSYSSTSRNFDSTEKSTPLGGTTTVGDKLLILSVATTAQPTNEAVTSNLSKKHLIILTLSSFIVRSVAIN